MKVLWAILEVKIVLRCLPALTFLPLEEVNDRYRELQVAKDDLIQRGVVQGDSVERINKLFGYFQRNYAQRPNGNDATFPASLWNMHERAILGLPITNNCVENWKGQFNGYFRHDSPPLADVLLKLQTDEEKTRQKIEIRARNPMQRVTGGIKSQKVMYSASQIKQLTANYTRRAEGSRMEFLVSIAAHLEKYQGH